jgi:hypothetical protein
MRSFTRMCFLTRMCAPSAFLHTCAHLCTRVQICAHVYKYAHTCANMRKRVQICKNVCKYAKTCANMQKCAHGLLALSKPPRWLWRRIPCLHSAQYTHIQRRAFPMLSSGKHMQRKAYAHTHTHTSIIYIYIYICVCVCVCVYIYNNRCIHAPCRSHRGGCGGGYHNYTEQARDQAPQLGRAHTCSGLQCSFCGAA